MKIALASDHGGYVLKEEIKKLLQEQQVDFQDFGTNSADSVDYPDYALPVAEAVSGGV